MGAEQWQKTGCGIIHSSQVDVGRVGHNHKYI